MKIKLNKNDIAQTSQDALTLFRSGIPNPVTRKKYEERLKEFVCSVLEDYLEGDAELREKQRQQRLEEGDKKKIISILDADFAIRVNEFVQKAKQNPDDTMGILLTYSEKLKERCNRQNNDVDSLKPQTIPNLFKPIKKLFKMNGVHFEWSRIDVTMPAPETNPNSRGYTHDEIRQLIKFSNPMEQAVAYLASSSGIRRGAFDFTWSCIKPIYRKNGELVMGNFDDNNDSSLVCGMLSVYAGSIEQYFALFSSEAWNAIKVYRTQWKSDTMKFPSSQIITSFISLLESDSIFITKSYIPSTSITSETRGIFEILCFIFSVLCASELIKTKLGYDLL